MYCIENKSQQNVLIAWKPFLPLRHSRFERIGYSVALLLAFHFMVENIDGVQESTGEIVGPEFM